jgi:uncharacterized repeat protein (TIGR02543 family)
VTVTGLGRVVGNGISCGLGNNACAITPAVGTAEILTASPEPGWSFTGWTGACTGTSRTCVVTVTGVLSASATFSNPSAQRGPLTSLAKPVVTRQGREFQVTLRFSSTTAGTARIVGLRAGRVASSDSLKIAAGPTTARFPVASPGFYRFEVTIASALVSWTTCLGRCGNAVKSPPFTVTRQAPTVKRAGQGWSVTIHLHANAISDDHLTVLRGATLLTQLHLLGRAGTNSFAPFLLVPGQYTVEVSAMDAYGRVRRVSWLVALAR